MKTYIVFLLLLWLVGMLFYGAVTCKGVDDSRVSAALMFLWHISAFLFVAISVYKREVL